MPMLTIPETPDTRPLNGYVARPTGEGPWPGVLVIHEAWGLDDQTQLAADRLATMGFLAVAPDLYRGRGLRCVRSVMRAMTAGRGPVFDDLEACRQWLLAQGGCTGRVGVLGMCMGGGFALLLGATGDYAAVSDNYGQLPQQLDVLQDSCPVVASYGGRDKGLRGVADRLEQALTEYGVVHDVKEYPEAGHSFLNERANAPVLIRPLMRMTGSGPEPASAADAWARIETFFREHLAERVNG